ncbi:MAG: T9SS type A sorting domain-containing protein [Flavobacteriales bacterium]|jgi:hypothetical protein|nr:T9SS type A sorting domain-containing protein [Flavobacteriales bacterium]
MKRFILHIILFGFSFSAFSQTGINISFGSNDIQLPDTVTMGDTIHFNCWIVNQGEDVLAGQIHLKAALQDTSGTLTNIRTVGGQGPVFIYPGDSVQFIQNFLFEAVTTVNYNVGDNIVVIWPKLANPVLQTNEYVYNDVHVKQNTTIISNQNIVKNDKVLIYPIPVSDVINFENNLKIDQIKIFTIEGKLVESKKVISNTCSLKNIKNGNYIISIFFNGNLIENKKIIIKK